MGVLGQFATPNHSTSFVAWTANDETVVSTIFMCGIDGSGITAFSLWIVPKGETQTNRHLIYHKASLVANNTVQITAGITLSKGDSIHVQAETAAGLCCSIFGAVV